jgi:hypothetical protein
VQERCARLLLFTVLKISWAATISDEDADSYLGDEDCSELERIGSLIVRFSTFATADGKWS